MPKIIRVFETSKETRLGIKVGEISEHGRKIADIAIIGKNLRVCTIHKENDKTIYLSSKSDIFIRQKWEKLNCKIKMTENVF